MGLYGNPLTTLHSVLRCKLQQVLDEELLSEEISQETGVAEEDNLSPLLFSLFIAYLYYEFKRYDLGTIVYANDLVLGSSSHSYLQQSRSKL